MQVGPLRSGGGISELFPAYLEQWQSPTIRGVGLAAQGSRPLGLLSAALPPLPNAHPSFPDFLGSGVKGGPVLGAWP